jgi:hypothetical protein
LFSAVSGGLVYKLVYFTYTLEFRGSKRLLLVLPPHAANTNLVTQLTARSTPAVPGSSQAQAAEPHLRSLRATPMLKALIKMHTTLQNNRT